MTDVRIGRLEIRGRLPGDDAAARARAEQVVATACGELLEQAFDRAGVREDGELCIRALDVAAPLPWGRGDVAMATAWSLRVAEAARAAVEAGGSGVVRYDSVAQALCDVLNGAAQGDFSRAWAWSQLGLWPGGDDVRGVVAALTARPELCAAVLRETAARGQVAPLLRALPGEAWTRVARAALVAAGVSLALADVAPTQGTLTAGAGSEAPGRASHHPAADAESPARPGDDTYGEAAREALRARVREVATASPLCRAARRAASFGLSPAARRALAVLALAEADPAALRGARAQHFVNALDDDLRARSGSVRPHAPRSDAEGARATAVQASATHVPAAARDDGTQAEAHAEREAREARNAGDLAQRSHGAPARPDADDARTGRVPADSERAAPARAGRADDARAERDGERDARTHTPDDSRGEEALFDDDALVDVGGDSEPPVARQRGHTRFGGLLFLLHVVDALGLPNEWSEGGPLAARPLRVALHGLALALLRDAGHDDVASDDPAVLAFAGLRPGDAPPLAENGATETHRNETEHGGANDASHGTALEALTRGEHAAIDDAARRIAEAVAERLSADPVDWRSSATPLAPLVARRAEIVADPGWIELRLALDAIDTRVRRAGLDLDPGYVPWLGVVVKFRYV